MYKVIKFFTDLQDKNHAYKVGDTFPRDGVEVSLKRLKELSSANNKRGVPLIEEIKEEPFMNPPEEPKPKRARKKG